LWSKLRNSSREPAPEASNRTGFPLQAPYRVRAPPRQTPRIPPRHLPASLRQVGVPVPATPSSRPPLFSLRNAIARHPKALAYKTVELPPRTKPGVAQRTRVRRGERQVEHLRWLTVVMMKSLKAMAPVWLNRPATVPSPSQREKPRSQPAFEVP